MTENPYKGWEPDGRCWQEGFSAGQDQRLRLAKENIRLAKELTAERAENARLREELEQERAQGRIDAIHTEGLREIIRALEAELEAARLSGIAAMRRRWSPAQPDLSQNEFEGVIAERVEKLTTPPAPVSPEVETCSPELPKAFALTGHRWDTRGAFGVIVGVTRCLNCNVESASCHFPPVSPAACGATHRPDFENCPNCGDPPVSPDEDGEEE